MVYPYNVILFCTKRNKISNHEKTRRNNKCILPSETSQSEKTTRCMIPSIGHFDRGKTTVNKRRVVASNSGKEEMNGQSTENVYDSETILYGI